MTSCFRLALIVLTLASGSIEAAVLRFELTDRLASSHAGYEEIRGRLAFAVDPLHSANALIVDLDKAPVQPGSRVGFSSDVRILTPRAIEARNGVGWFEIPNRGGKASPPAAMLKTGYTFVSVGWEFDVPREPDKLRIEVPRARNGDLSPIRGVVSATFVLDKRQDSHLLTDLAEYPVVDPSGKESRLVVRNRAAFPEGTEVPRDQWMIEEGGRVRLQGGFEPGRTYEIFYISEAPPIGGLGYAAIRDAVAWLRNAPDAPVNVRYAYAFGASQCGRFLRDFIYLGFNTDELGRRVFDGVLAHVAGAGRLVLNRRWATPRALAGYETTSYPFADAAELDSVSGCREGVLKNTRVNHEPKIFYTNMAAEYWGAGRVAALTHTDPAGTRDLDLPENVRSYFFSGTSHGPASFPPAVPVKGGLPGNPVNAGPAIAALREAMHRWVAEGLAPPASVYPRFSDGTLVRQGELNFPAIPGVPAPRGVSAGCRVANALLPNGAGAGTALPLLVPAIDEDGNDLGGIRMPEMAVPLGTGMGWVFRPREFGESGEFHLLRGAWVPFPINPSSRLERSDPRVSVMERYPDREKYLARIHSAATELVSRRFLLEADVPIQVKLAGERWDWVTSRAAP